MNAAKKIILLLWLVLVASLGNVSASTPGATENRTWEKSLATAEMRLGEPLQTLGRHQENEGAGYDYAPDSLLAAESGAAKVVYPGNSGFVTGEGGQASVLPGQILDRYGGTGGRFLSPAGTPAAARSLAPVSEALPLNSYQVMKPFEAGAGQAAPWFGQPGGGLQFYTGRGTTVQDLINSGHLQPVP